MDFGENRQRDPPLDVGAEPERGRPTAVRYVVLGWLCLLATLAYVHRGCLAVPAKLVQEELRLSKEELAQVLAGFFLGYMIFQLPSGWLGDRWGTRRTLSLLVLLWSVATGCMGFAESFAGLWLSRVVTGLAQAGVFSCCVQTIARWFPDKARSGPNGLLASFMSIGAVIATGLTGLLLQYLTWREVLFVVSLPGLLLALGFFWWFRDEPAAHGWVNAEELALIHGTTTAQSKSSTARDLSSVWSILLGVPMLLVCAQQFFRAAGYIFYLTWFPTFLQMTRAVSVEDSGLLASLPLLGVCLGSAAGGFLLDLIYRVTGSKQHSRQTVTVASLLACSLFILLAYVATSTLAIMVLLTIGSFCAGLGGPAAYTVTIDLGGRHVATVFSTMNMSGNLGAFLLPLVVVELVDWYSWNEALLLLALLYFAAALCWTLVRVEASSKPATAEIYPAVANKIEEPE